MSDLNDYQIIQVGDLPVAETLEGLNILGFDSTNNRAVRALMALLRGLDGKPVELQKTATHLQWRVQGGTWANLLALDEVKGDKGDPNTLTIGTVQTGATSSATITGTAPNQTLNLTLQKGDTGSNIELQKTTTHVQWRVVGGTWANLIPLSDLKGEQGDDISLQKTTTHIQWRLGTGAWTDLVALSELKGEKGDAPVKGVDYFDGADGKNAVMTIGTITTVASNAQANATIEPDGVDAEGKPKFKLNLWLPKGVDGEGAGDMLKSVYDPSGKNGDAFSQDNMKDGTVNKNFTQTDRDNIGEKYVKPGTGIPKADLAAAVQTSLGKADSALQSFTETDPTVPSWAKAASKPSYSYTEITGTKPPTDAQKNSDITKAEIEAKLTGAITSHTHDYVGTSGNETIAGTKTFSTIPVLPASNPTTDNQAARKKYVDDGLSAKLDSSKMKVVTELPASPDSGTFYFVKE